VSAGDPFAPIPSDPGAETIPQSTLTAVAVSHIELGMRTSERSLQHTIGASEVGHPCDRRLAYRINGVAPVNFSDPTRQLVGIGAHHVVEDLHHRLDRGTGRFLTEVSIIYRGTPGRVDMFDRYLGALYDWKTTGKARLATYRKNGIPPAYRVQVQVYGVGMALLGHDVKDLAVFFLPYDGALSQCWSWETKPDRGVADAAIDRLLGLHDCQEPAAASITPDRLCAYCPFYNPRTADLNLGCPATKGKASD
jgi:hypothetical protein